MSDIKRYESSGRMSQAVSYGELVFLAGQVGKTPNDVKAQTAEALAEVDRLLAAAGSSKSRIISVTIWLADIADFAVMNGVYDSWVDMDNRPARATSEAKLAAPEYRVEVIVIAAKA